ncbi:hypothetical protein ACFL6S_30125 [Candidatus Poribacteria bacterium]
MPLTEALRREYQTLFDTCIIQSSKLGIVDGIVNRMQGHQSTYTNIQDQLGVPWYVVGAIHQMEGSMNFNTHLHNGDPLTARTKHVPKGRPEKGDPPFTWEESALDSLKYTGLHRWNDWTVPGTLYRLEQYNGWGYRSRNTGVNSPYLWSFSNHYTRGKFVKDGIFSSDAVSKQCGAAIILRRMAEKEVIDLPTPEEVGLPIVRSDSVVPYGERLQNFLNTFPEIYLVVDGKPGEKTSDAFRKVFGSYLSGDTRA